MAEKDIKKTPAATQTVQPSADKYTIQELENASTKVFAAMQSIGMTNRQLRRLIMDEGLYYAAGADVIGGLLAAILGVTVLKNVLNSPSMWYFTLRFTLVPALFIAVIYLILAAIIPVVVLHFFNKGSVVERLRTE